MHLNGYSIELIIDLVFYSLCVVLGLLKLFGLQNNYTTYTLIKDKIELEKIYLVRCNRSFGFLTMMVFVKTEKAVKPS